MHISFHGAARTVTGSKHLITLENDFQILLDCGMFQGLGASTPKLNESLGFDASAVYLVLLSHAHIDHSGLIPKLVAEGFTGRILCTRPTLELSEILLMDSAEIQSQQQKDNNQPACYSVDSVKDALKLFEIVRFDEWLICSRDVSVLFTETGHLVGSASIHLKITEGGKETNISFSGDVGRARHPLLKPATPFPQADYIILESTYGDKHHQVSTSNVDQLRDHIQKTCIEKQGKLIIPAFSVGRTQELLFMLNQLELEKRLPDLKYFIDSPLSLKATEIIKSHLLEFNEGIQKILEIDDDPFLFQGLRLVENVDDSIRLTEYGEPCVIISSSGTADAGRVRHHINAGIGDQKNTILFSGYCSPDSLGGQLLAGAKEISVFQTIETVKADIKQLKGLSAHGDSDDLCQFISCQDPGQVRGIFLVHGEPKVQEALAAKLKTKSFYPVTIPELHENIKLNRMSAIPENAVPSNLALQPATWG
jgi:metallo-beta-lactamase family protein